MTTLPRRITHFVVVPLACAGAVTLAGPGGTAQSRAGDGPVTTAAMSVPATSAAAVSRARAEGIARRHIVRRFGQRARVTGSGREDDYGARWEVEVTRADGVEFDVYVNARGRVVRVIRTGRD